MAAVLLLGRALLVLVDVLATAAFNEPSRTYYRGGVLSLPR
jgi:hypothetical protein